METKPSPTEALPGALNGIRVLDLSRILAAPMAAQMLGDLGAEVIKVERPIVGDDARAYSRTGPTTTREGKLAPESPFFLCANRNKKSITLDLATPAGQDIVKKLAAQCDVLIENYKVGTLARYGLDYESLKSVNPRLVYLSLTGYGQSGPYSHRPGFDAIFQAMGGLMSITGHPDEVPGGGPVKVGSSIIDVMTGYNAVIAILAALRHRDAVSGEGQFIDMALMDVSIACLTHTVQQYLSTGTAPARRGNEGNGGLPAQVLTCRDGALYLSVGTNYQFDRFCDVVGEPAIAADPRFTTMQLRLANRHELKAWVDAAVREWSADALMQALDAASVPVGRINDFAQVFADPQVRHRGMKLRMNHPDYGDADLIANPIRLSHTPVSYRQAPPRLGEHTDEVLHKLLNLDKSTVARLRDEGIV